MTFFDNWSAADWIALVSALALLLGAYFQVRSSQSKYLDVVLHAANSLLKPQTDRIDALETKQKELSDRIQVLEQENQDLKDYIKQLFNQLREAGMSPVRFIRNKELEIPEK